MIDQDDASGNIKQRSGSGIRENGSRKNPSRLFQPASTPTTQQNNGIARLKEKVRITLTDYQGIAIKKRDDGLRFLDSRRFVDEKVDLVSSLLENLPEANDYDALTALLDSGIRVDLSICTNYGKLTGSLSVALESLKQSVEAAQEVHRAVTHRQ